MSINRRLCMKKIIFAVVMMVSLNSFAEPTVRQIDELNHYLMNDLSKIADMALRADYWEHRGFAQGFRIEKDKDSDESLIKGALAQSNMNGSEVSSLEEIQRPRKNAHEKILETAILLVDHLGSDAESCTPLQDHAFDTRCATRALMIALVKDILTSRDAGRLSFYTGWLNADHAEEKFITIIDREHNEVLVIDSLYDS